MGTTCLIPVSFAVLGCSAYENFHNDLSYKKSLLEGGLPSLIGGIIIWICFLLASAILCRWYFCLNQIIMKRILVQRTYRGSAYTIGKLFIDGNYICDTLEDVDRGLSSNMSEDEIKKIKIYGETAIPAGTYKVIMNVVSEKFKNRVWAKPYKGKLPRLVDVPGYEGVLIHVGNTAKDTLGCILVGENKVKGQVISSTNAFNKLMNILKDEEDIELTIK